MEAALHQVDRLLELTDDAHVTRDPTNASYLIATRQLVRGIRDDIVVAQQATTGQVTSLTAWEDKIANFNKNQAEPKRSKSLKTKRIAYVLRAPIDAGKFNAFVTSLGPGARVNTLASVHAGEIIGFAGTDKVISFETDTRCTDNKLWDLKNDWVIPAKDDRVLFRPQSANYWDRCNTFRLNLSWYSHAFTEREIDAIQLSVLKHFDVTENVIFNREHADGEPAVMDGDSMTSIGIYYGIHVGEAVKEWTYKDPLHDDCEGDYITRRFKCWACMHERHWADFSLDGKIDCFEALLAKYAQSHRVPCCSECTDSRIYSADLKKCRVPANERDE